MLQTFEDISEGIKRDKGTRFETLIRDWLTKEPTYKDLFSEVLTYKDWSTRHPELVSSKRDIGIDLVGVNADRNGFTAIQCKFYAKDATVGKSGIDSFIAASNKSFFTRRFLVATNEKWSDNVVQELQNIKPSITLITRENLVKSVVDWSAYGRGELKTVANRKPREYQKEAIKNVLQGFIEADRGKLIMACGTGKTYTSLKIAEEQAGKGKLVLFLIPSLSLLSQTLTDWKQQCIYPIKAFAVCSDTSTGKANLEDTDSLTVGSELSYPATTDATKLGEQVTEAIKNKDAMTVIFSTYQSIDVIHQAQKLKENTLPEIDFVICDEAHRTAGGHVMNEEEATFTRIHDNNYVRAKKRLYMTATPKIYGTAAKQQQDDGDVVLYSMDDEKIYGKTFHTINFTQAVRLGSLVDYKVIVLTVNESLVGDKDNPDDLLSAASGGIPISHAAKIIGCWRALSKQDLQSEVSLGDDTQPMKRAVGFAQIIAPSEDNIKVASKQFTAQFQNVINNYMAKEITENKLDPTTVAQQYSLVCDTRHIDGKMDATEKANRLEWLRAPVEDNHCKILFNVRCLSEGVDVPSLDAVLFLSPRKSMVDVVQTVGRVMRTSKETKKERGYVIIPIVTPAGVPADAVLDNNKDFETVWQVLRALKSIDDDFGAMVDGQLKSISSDKMEVICLTDKKFVRKMSTEKKGRDGTTIVRTKKKSKDEKQLVLDLGRDAILENTIKARIVKKVGNRKEWSDWAESVGEICQKQIAHIKAVLNNPENKDSKKKFESFTEELKATLNGDITEEEVLEMLGQHIVTKPVMDALFEGFPFMEKNPISKAMTSMLQALDKEGMKSATKLLEGFYNSVRIRAKNIKTTADRQTVILELFDKFFKFAFPKMRDKLGIVYTPVPVVDFINRSVADVLKKEFDTDIAAQNVHILDPFTGTGTFLTRLMQSGLIEKDKLNEKFTHDIHAYEIVPLAYYVASMNLESTLHELVPGLEYKPNQVMVLTDTFADHDRKDLFETSLIENNRRLANSEKLDIRVIVGNPPYSSGQDTVNDNNENEHYETLDSRIGTTYASGTEVTNKNSLYDSYIRGIRWASDRIKDKGVIGFITNAGWLESNSANGMRKCLTKEFNRIYIFHLRGGIRGKSGDYAKREGKNIFDIMTAVAIVILVKNPKKQEIGNVFFHSVNDYLSREEKLEQLIRYGSISNVEWTRIFPDQHGDWLNQRSDSFEKFLRMDGKKTEESSIFSKDYSRGLGTYRDSWCYNYSRLCEIQNISRLISFYIHQKDLFQKEKNGLPSDKQKTFNPKNFVAYDSKKIAWTERLLESCSRGAEINFEKESLTFSLYRPFIPSWVYFNSKLNDRVYQMPKLFPTSSSENLAICVTGVGNKNFSCLMTGRIIDLNALEAGVQCFPRYIYQEAKGKQGEDDMFEDANASSPQTDGYVKVEAITDAGLKHFQDVYPENLISKNALFYYIYGILHNQQYREKYANNLSKELPRIPRVATYEQFKTFSEAGKKLANLHVNFEQQERYADVEIERKPGASYRVTQMKWGKIKGKTGNAAKDKSILIYNEGITIKNIPLAAQEYVVNKKSALDWIVERCRISVDKDSGIVNDFNKYGEELGIDDYPLDLFLKMITVSLETMKIVKALPVLEIHPLDQA